MTLAEQLIEFIERNERAINSVEYGDLAIKFERCTLVRVEFMQSVMLRKGEGSLTTLPIAEH